MGVPGSEEGGLHPVPLLHPFPSIDPGVPDVTSDPNVDSDPHHLLLFRRKVWIAEPQRSVSVLP